MLELEAMSFKFPRSILTDPWLPYLVNKMHLGLLFQLKKLTCTSDLTDNLV